MPRGPLRKFAHPYLGESLASVREQRQLTQKDISRKVKARQGTLTPEYYSAIERGAKQPSLEALASILEALDMSADDFALVLQETSQKHQDTWPKPAPASRSDLDALQEWMQQPEAAEPFDEEWASVFLQLSHEKKQLLLQVARSMSQSSGQ